MVAVSENPDQGGSKIARIATAVLLAVGYAVLLSLGFVAGIVSGLAASWLSWLWQTGSLGKVVAGVTLVVLCGLLFAGCRAAEWGMGSRIGSALPAAGWVVAGFTLISVSSAGDIVMTSAVINYGFLFGGIGAVVLATAVSSAPGPGSPPSDDQPTQNWNSA
ncbi:DUF6113 family protein [Salinactinospora qingdaonensis]|uniref:Uncharacterized protein n=1 Tax=Salinactinospora qingdaonensis TaxID=702744 RepID=A0ABP7FMM0_9ACTN